MNEKHRRVLILFEWEGLSTQEIADLIGARVGTVRVRLHRARSRFLQEYERRFPGGGPAAGTNGRQGE